MATGDLKLAGPVSTQVRMLLEENAALQVINLNPVSFSDMLITLNNKCNLFAAGQPTGQHEIMTSRCVDASTVYTCCLHLCCVYTKDNATSFVARVTCAVTESSCATTANSMYA